MQQLLSFEGSMRGPEKNNKFASAKDVCLIESSINSNSLSEHHRKKLP